MFDFFKRAKDKYTEKKDEEFKRPELTQEQRNYAVKKLAMSIPALRCICECCDKAESDEDYIESLEICIDMLQTNLKSAQECPGNRDSVKSYYEGMIKAISAKL